MLLHKFKTCLLVWRCRVSVRLCDLNITGSLFSWLLIYLCNKIKCIAPKTLKKTLSVFSLQAFEIIFTVHESQCYIENIRKSLSVRFFWFMQFTFWGCFPLMRDAFLLKIQNSSFNYLIFYEIYSLCKNNAISKVLNKSEALHFRSTVHTNTTPTCSDYTLVRVTKTTVLQG